MKKIIYFFVLFFVSISVFSQCFDCGKNYGGSNSDIAGDIVTVNDGVLNAVNFTTFDSGNILMKNDFNCNLIWSKQFGDQYTYLYSITTDDAGNIYILLSNNNLYNFSGPSPFNVDGTMLYQGLTLYKLDSTGNIIWYRKVGGNSGGGLTKLFNKQNILFVVAGFSYEANVNNEILLTTDNYYTIPQSFIAKFDLDGALIDAKKAAGLNTYTTAATIDDSGNIYMTTTLYSNLYAKTTLDKYDSSLNLSLSTIISETSNVNTHDIYHPTDMHYSSVYDKLYIWGNFFYAITMLGSDFVTSGTNYDGYNSVLTEFNPNIGILERIKQVKNKGTSPSRGYFAEKNNDLYIFTNYTEVLEFPNTTLVSTSFDIGSGTYYSQDMVLFKIDLASFDSEYILKSSSTSDFVETTQNYANKILFRNDDLYMTATFESKPLTINDVIINNNSANLASDAMLYKFNINSINSGEIIVDNTCLNDLTSFELNGNFDSINWNFGDPTSSSNTSNASNPEHQFSSDGNYIIKATVTCAGGTQIIEKEILITSKPIISPIAPLIECETVSGSGVSSFNTSTINASLVNGQQNVIVEYYDANGVVLPSPLPNPYINTVVGGDIITARLSFVGNPDCYDETSITFTTSSKPIAPLVISPQTFCKQENATLNEIAITGQNIKWYDAATGGTLLPNATLLLNGTTYYVSQTINGCESERIAVAITVYETVAPTGLAVQTFCDSQVLTLADFVVTGTDVAFYDAAVGGNLLPMTTTLIDGATYYASQTLNGCESVSRLALVPDIISGVPANGYSELMCDALDDGLEVVDLSDYNGNLIANASTYTFKYYTSLTNAENEISGTNVVNFSNYTLVTGLNTIYVRVMFANSCYEVVALELTVVALPQLNMKDTYVVCENGFVTITADGGFDSYNWSTGAVTQSIMVSQGGAYDVTVTKNTNGLVCSASKNITVEVSERATITAVETVDWTTSENVITVFVDGSGVYEYSVDGVNFQSSNQFYGLPNGEYTVYVNDTKGCGVAKKDVYLLMYPKYFTPNGDTYNDNWGIQFYQNEINLVVKIFDRYGKFIKQLTANDPLWDGTYNGYNLPATDYWFTVIREDGTEYKGHFTLKR